MPQDFISSGNHLSVKLHTDSYVAMNGFLARYQTGAISQLSSCGANNTFNCPDWSTCIPASMVCDGHQECTDGSDELIATCGNWTCATGKFTCTSNNPKCIPSIQKCDGHRDCSDGSDESDEVCGMTNVECCRQLEIRSSWIATFVKDVHPTFFTKYRIEIQQCRIQILTMSILNTISIFLTCPTCLKFPYSKIDHSVESRPRMEEDKFNGKPHYTSADGRYALSYASDCDYWLLQGCGPNVLP